MSYRLGGAVVPEPIQRRGRQSGLGEPKCGGADAVAGPTVYKLGGAAVVSEPMKRLAGPESWRSR